MKTKLKIISAILAALTMLSVVSCRGGDKTPEDGEKGDEFSGSIGDRDPGDSGEEKPSEDDGSEDSVVTITTAEQLASMKRKGKYVLGSDIDLTGVKWEPFGTYEAPFEGVFDGAGHKITGLSVDEADEDVGETISFSYSYCGFFGVIKNAVVKDVAFENVSINVSDYHDNRSVTAGAVCGLAISSEIDGCSASGEVSASSTSFIAVCGGIAGTVKGTEVVGCVSGATVVATESAVRAEAGGIVGATGLSSSVRECVSSGSVTASAKYEIAYAGGIIGYCYSTEADRCTASGNIYAEVASSDPERGTKGAAYAGGLAGAVSAASNGKSVFGYSRCISDEVRSDGKESAAYAGGLTGTASYAEFNSCYSTADIFSRSEIETVYASGLVTVIDSTALIKACYTTGDVTVSAFSEKSVVLGVCTASAPSDVSKIVVDCIYRADATFTVGNNVYTAGSSELIRVNGSQRNSNVFSNLSLLCQSLGWDTSEWTMSEGLPVAG